MPAIGARSHREYSPSTVSNVGVAVTKVQFVALLAVAQDHAFGQPPDPSCGPSCSVSTSRPPRQPTRRNARRRGGRPPSGSWAAPAMPLRWRAVRGRDRLAGPIHAGRQFQPGGIPSLGDQPRRPRPIRRRPTRLDLAVVAGGRKAAELNFRMACEVADAFAVRLGLDEPVRAALATNFERWNATACPTVRGVTTSPGPCGSLNSLRNSKSWPGSRSHQQYVQGSVRVPDQLRTSSCSRRRLH